MGKKGKKRRRNKFLFVEIVLLVSLFDFLAAGST